MSAQKIIPFNISRENDLTISDLQSLFTKEEIEKGEKRFEIKTFGPWNICKSVKGLAVATIWSGRKGEPSCRILAYRVLGYYTMHNPSQSGYELEGKVKIKGKYYRAFTSSNLFSWIDYSIQNPDKTKMGVKKYVNCAVLHICDFNDWK